MQGPIFVISMKKFKELIVERGVDNWQPPSPCPQRARFAGHQRRVQICPGKNTHHFELPSHLPRVVLPIRSVLVASNTACVVRHG